MPRPIPRASLGDRSNAYYTASTIRGGIERRVSRDERDARNRREAEPSWRPATRPCPSCARHKLCSRFASIRKTRARAQLNLIRYTGRNPRGVHIYIYGEGKERARARKWRGPSARGGVVYILRQHRVHPRRVHCAHVYRE